MNDREKLVELIKHGRSCPDDLAPFADEMCKQCRYAADVDCDISRLADHLLAHGVTIREPGGYSDDDCFREKIEHQLKGIYEHLRDVDSAIDTLRAQTLPLRENVIHWFTESNMHKNVRGSECHCGAPMKGESK